MTWGEFKAAVEKQGVKDTDELFYVDLDTFYPTIKVVRGVDNSVQIEGDWQS